MPQRALVGDVHHSKLVPDAGGNALNEKVPTSILNGPPEAETSCLCPYLFLYGNLGASLEGVSGLTRRKRRH